MELLLAFDALDRNTAPERLAPGTAPVLQRVELMLRPGSVSRANGSAATQTTPPSTTVTGAYVALRNDGKRVLLDSNTAGTVRLTPGDGTKTGSGPLPEWNDSTSTET
jgi:hypothetical protein